MEPVHQQPAQPVAKPTTPPVMDVRPPRAPQPQQQSQPESVKIPPQDNVALPSSGPEEKKDDAPKKQRKQVVTKPPKASRAGGGVGLAIFATIVIVLGLGALIVYAYLRTNGISIL